MSQKAINPWIIAMTVMLATFMEVLDTSVANVALPHIAGNLSAGIDESTWVLTSYLVSNAIILPMGGWFSMLFGRKRFYMLCVAIFTAASLLCGIAPTLGALIFFRVLQGLGGGALQPVSQAILRESFPREKQGMAMAVYGMGVVLAPVIGPTLGGGYQDFQLPPGELSVNWVAVGPGNSDVSSGIDVTVLSPQLYCKPSPSGVFHLAIFPPGANIRVVAQRKGFSDAFQLRVSFEIRNAQ